MCCLRQHCGAKYVEPSSGSNPASVLVSSHPGAGKRAPGTAKSSFPMLRVAMLMRALYVPSQQALFVPRVSDLLVSPCRPDHIPTSAYAGETTGWGQTSERSSHATVIQQLESCGSTQAGQTTY